MKELLLTFLTRKYRGELSMYEYHIFRLYRKYVMAKVLGETPSKEDK